MLSILAVNQRVCGPSINDQIKWQKKKAEAEISVHVSSVQASLSPPGGALESSADRVWRY